MAPSSGEAGRAAAEIATAVGEVAAGAEKQVRAVEQARQRTAEMATAAQPSAAVRCASVESVAWTRAGENGSTAAIAPTRAAARSG